MKTSINYNELFYLGSILDAKYIDYTYYSAIDDIDSEKEVLFSNAQKQLIKKDLLYVDFSGNIEIDEQLKILLYPLFFGTKVSELNVFSKDGEYSVTKIHFSDETCTVVTLFDNHIIVENEEIDINDILSPLSIPEEDSSIEENLEEEAVNLIIAKNGSIDNEPQLSTYALTQNKLYKITQDEEYLTISYKQLCEDLIKILFFREG